MLCILSALSAKRPLNANPDSHRDAKINDAKVAKSVSHFNIQYSILDIQYSLGFGTENGESSFAKNCVDRSYELRAIAAHHK